MSQRAFAVAAWYAFVNPRQTNGLSFDRILNNWTWKEQATAVVFLQVDASALISSAPDGHGRNESIGVNKSMSVSGAARARNASRKHHDAAAKNASGASWRQLGEKFTHVGQLWWMAGENSTRSTPAFADNMASFAIVLLPVVIILVLIGIVVIATKSDDIRYDPSRHAYARHGRRKQQSFPPSKAALPPAPHSEYEEYAARTPVMQPGMARAPPLAASSSRPASMALAQGSSQSPPPAYVRVPSAQGSASSAPGRSPPPAMSRQPRDMVLCSQLVLPHCEAWFAVPWLRMLHGPDFELFGISGRPLLRGEVGLAGAGHRTLQLSMTPPKSPALGSISNDAGSGALTVRDGESDLFGVLTFARIGVWTLKTEVGDILQVNINENTGEISLRQGTPSRAVAEAVRCVESEFFGQGDHLEMRLEPGTDSVLVVLCVLGVVLFGLPTSLPHSRSLAAGLHAQGMDSD